MNFSQNINSIFFYNIDFTILYGMIVHAADEAIFDLYVTQMAKDMASGMEIR